MVRLSIDLLADAPQYVNPVKERELNLRSYKIPVIENMGVTRDQFDTVDLTDNDIKRLDNVPLLKRLTTLYLHNNRIHYIQQDIGDALPNLRRLMLTNNNICELGDIDPLAKCKKLEHLSFHGNPITHRQHYRLYIIYRLPSVRVLDFQRVKLKERDDARRLFKGKKNKKLLEEVGKKSANAEVEEQDKENVGLDQPTHLRVMLNDDDREKIREAIKNAKSMQEIEYLNGVLESGRVPEKGWNAGLEFARMNFAESEDANENEFRPETEENGEEQEMEQ